MASETFELFRQAILEKKRILCSYNGLPREVCSHAMVWTDGQETALVFQFGGESSSGLPPSGKWRCLTLARVVDIRLAEGPWVTEDHAGQQRCSENVAAEVRL